MNEKIGDDILIEHEEQKRLISLLKATPFEKFEVNTHFLNKFGKPRHGITLEKAKEIYYQFEKIINVFKRPSIIGFKYSFVYKINKNYSYYLIFLLDEKPMKLFNAIPKGKSIEKRLARKYVGFFNK